MLSILIPVRNESDALEDIIEHCTKKGLYTNLITSGVLLNPDRLKTEGYGEERPLTDNDTIEGRLTNRRVQFRAEF